MELVSSYGWLGPKREYSVGVAVELVCTDYDCEGIAERASGNIAETAQLLGRLVEELHLAGTLSEDAVLRIVGPAFKKEE